MTMNTLVPHKLMRMLAGWLLVLATTAGAAPSVQTLMSSRFLARGEKAAFQIVVPRGVTDGRMPAPPAIPNVAIQAEGASNRLLPGRQIGYVFQYSLTSFEVGRHVIPSIPLVLDGVTMATEPIEFEVFDPNDLQWQEVRTDNGTFRYAAGIRALKKSPYEGENLPVEIKIYVRDRTMVEDWGIPEFERDGVACWRFEPSSTTNRVTLLGQSYIALAYPSLMSPTRAGKVSIGPAKIRLVTIEAMADSMLRREYVNIELTVPKLELDAKKLPAGAPEGFSNAVGKFTLEASAAQTELREGDPVSVDVAVTGSGNLDALEAPKPIDPDGWKIYESSANQRGDERRQLSGSVVFRQFMRPISAKASVPPFRLVYFDPDLAEYKTVLSEAIPLKLLPSTGPATISATPPQAAGTPVERMTDILGLLPASPPLSAVRALPSWLLHLTAGAAALILILKAFAMRMKPKFQVAPDVAARRQALRDLERKPGNEDVEFLRRSGAFIERWLGDASSREPELQAILAERDAVCFRSEKPSSALQQGGRSRILRVIRKAAWLWALAACVFLQDARAAEPDAPAAAPSTPAAAYEASDYETAIKLWLDSAPYDRLPADTLYNIGNASYRLGSPGYAALYYRRALDRDSSLTEARQNLRFLERKYGAVSVPHADYQYTLAKLKLQTWKNIAWGGLWLVVLGILVFPATRPGAKPRLAAILAVVAGPVLIGIGGLGWKFYPDDSRFAPIAHQAVVIVEKAVLHTDASRTSPEVIDAPPGSLCEVLERRGRWAYVGFATQTRGWIPVEQLESVVPEGAPEVPKIRKPKADSRSA